MRKKLTHNLYGKLVACFLVVGAILSGMFFAEMPGNITLASETEVEKHANGYLVKTYEADEFEKFRGETYTYPKLTSTDCADYQEWLFAGWFTDPDCTEAVNSSAISVTGDVYAKFVDVDLSYIKCQVTPGTHEGTEKTNMRLISSLESEDYSGAGFYITYKNIQDRRYPVSTVYKRLSATDDGMECGYSPIAFNEDAEYLSAFRMKNLSNASFDEPIYIQSYWVTLDGTEVRGMSRYVRVEDSYKHIVNVPVRMHSDVAMTSGTVSVMYDAEQFSLYMHDEYPNGYDKGVGFTVTGVNTDTSGKIVVTATADNEIAEGLMVNLRLQLIENATLESNTFFEVSEENFTSSNGSISFDVPDVLYKNYPVAYNGTVDKSWYKDFENNETFVITSAADLYGLAEIVNTSNNFSGKTIYLGADITVNQGTVDEWKQNLKDEDASNDPYKWQAIGYSTILFMGDFEGCGHTISGIYLTDEYIEDVDGNTYQGLFGQTSGSIANFSLENSYFKSTVGVENCANMGSVVGQLKGTLDTVYSEAVVESDFRYTGGLVGRSNGTDVTIENCWFNGSVQVNEESYSNAIGLGGILGIDISGTVYITDCLNSGDITYTETTTTSSVTGKIYPRVGGIIGNPNSKTVYITTCINAGSVTAMRMTEGLTVGNVAGITGNSTGVTESNNEDVSASLATYNGYKGYNELKQKLKFYDWKDDTGLENAEPGKWVCRETNTDAMRGIPVLKSFCDKWIDVSWYYDTLDSDSDADPTEFTISHTEQLYGWSEISNQAGVTFDSTQTVYLGADIEMNQGVATTWANSTNVKAREFIPINGSSTTVAFDGTFNGRGYKISGLYISPESSSVEGNGAGLFGYATGDVEALTLTNSYINSLKDSTGSIVGHATGNIKKVHVTDTVMLNSDSEKGRVGGLVGDYVGSDKTISNCWVEGTITSSNISTAGFVGRMSGMGLTIEDCLFSGSIVNTSANSAPYIGGMVGNYSSGTGAELTIRNCLSDGTVKATAQYAVGEIFGRGSGNATRTLTLENVYYIYDAINSADKEFYTTRTIKGLGTSTQQYSTVNGAAVQLATSNCAGTAAYQYTELNLGSKAENIDATWVLMSEGAPRLNIFSDSNVDSIGDVQKLSKDWYYNALRYSYNSTDKVLELNTTATQFTIQDADDMFGFADLVNTDQITFASGYTNGFWTANSQLTISLGTDIEFNGASAEGTEAQGWYEDPASAPKISWTPIGKTKDNPFKGIFDGNKKTISGLYLEENEAANVGLFGFVTGATIRGVRLSNSYITSTKDVVGSILGYSNGVTMDDVYSSAIIDTTNYQVGGITGRVQVASTFTNCWFDGLIEVNYTGTSNVYTAGIVGNIGNGGSKNATTLDSCLFSGEIIFDATYTHATNTNLAARVGGLVGTDNTTNTKVDIKNCLAAGVIEGTLNDNSTKATAMNGIGSVIGYAGSATTTASNNYVTTEMSKVIKGAEAVKVEEVCGYTSTSFVSTTFLAEVSDKETMQGYGARLFTTLPFKAEERTDGGTALWMARLGDVPVPSTFTDIVDGLDITEVDRVTVFEAGEETYEIDSIADLYGVAQLSQTDSLKGSTIILTDDIALNDLSGNWNSEDCGNSEQAILFPWWWPIGNSTYPFKGTFDGDGKTISGLYVNSDDTYMGLFGVTGESSTQKVTVDGVEVTVENSDASVVKNVRLVNSYFNQQNSAGYVGSIIGQMSGHISNVYSDAIIEGNGKLVGGLVGNANGKDYQHKSATDSDSNTTVTRARRKLTMSDCWFDGEIHTNISADNTYVAGIAGNISQGELAMTNCLFDGFINTDSKISYNKVYISGICGNITGQSLIKTETSKVTNYVYLSYDGTTVVEEGSAKTSLKLNSCVATGDITSVAESMQTKIGALVGHAGGNTLLVQNKVIAARDCYPMNIGYSESTATATGYAFQTYGDDRLIGYFNLKSGYLKAGNTGYSEENYQLTFGEDAWTMRTDGVPIPENLSDVVTTEFMPDATALAQEIGLDYWSANASINDLEYYGAGKYVVSYDTSEHTYEGYHSYLTNLNTLGFERKVYNEGTSTYTDGIISATYTRGGEGTGVSEWVLDVTYVTNESRIYISVNTDVDSIADSLDSASDIAKSDETSAVSLSLVELTNSARAVGNAFVYQLSDGHFIVSDGGNEADATGLITYMKELAGKTDDGKQNPVYIDAWFVTHFHEDHVGALHALYSEDSFNNNLTADVYLEAVYANEPSGVATSYYDSSAKIEAIDKAYRGVSMLTKKDGSRTDIYQIHMGQRYYFNGITMDVIDTQEQHSYETWDDYSDPDPSNASSTSCIFTVTSTEDKVFMGGDANRVNMCYIMKAYDDLDVNIERTGVFTHDDKVSGTVTETNSNTLQDISVFVSLHHGQNTVDAFTTYLFGEGNTANDSLKAVLVPCYKKQGDQATQYCSNADANNSRLFEKANGNYYSYGYDDSTKATEAKPHGTVKLTFTKDAITSTIYQSWFVLEPKNYALNEFSVE